MGLTTERVALISGAARGIGAATAKALFDAGWTVSLGMRRPQMPDWAKDAPERVHLYTYEATDPATATGWAQEVMERLGCIDAVVASAGISLRKTPVEITDAEMAQLLEVNVQGPRRLAAACWEPLAASGRGRVVLLASLSGKRVKSPGAGSYAVSKFAVVGLAHALRQAGYERGIRAVAVCPGFVATDMATAVEGRDPATMTQPVDLARVIHMLIDLPNEASVAEFHVNCQLGETY
ncbi:SDR family NAD(P)-dependent oxidoreductase [Salipiger sp. PrR002]|uniref:SDR family NAD(P)-dependent oxidoreductase n=1 Tax=Salipiger sp. PrR002 TaxID=2706489 RepID=UPI00194257B9|nr:SDR family NAD(P)-dependent oxidoreductase [Salipiger sp. PrR002]